MDVSFLIPIMLCFYRFQAVEAMRQGLTPTDAAEQALAKISSYYPSFVGALIAINATGHYGKGSLPTHWPATNLQYYHFSIYT